MCPFTRAVASNGRPPAAAAFPRAPDALAIPGSFNPLALGADIVARAKINSPDHGIFFHELANYSSVSLSLSNEALLLNLERTVICPIRNQNGN